MTDELSLSGSSGFIDQVRSMPEMRLDRIAALREQIANGTYETADKLDAALDRLLDELA